MPTPRTCPRCGADLVAESAHGLCPACLLGAALDAEGSAPTVGGVKAAEAIAGLRVRYVGDYELVDELARGGMGVIYKARQISLNRIVALKMIRSGELAGDDDIRRFHLEAEAAANLQHPNIVAIHEVGVHEGHHYFTMDLVDGRNLAQLAGGNPMAPERAARYAKTIAEAIHFAHQRGTLHRDLKPQNVLIDTSDRVRITDFGLAKQTRSEAHLTMSGAVMGSPSYMPPEQARGRMDLTGPSSDVYGVGAILYELLTGRAPFRGENAAATLAKVIDDDPVTPSKLNRAVPRDLETICLKCLEKPIERRYPTARALAEELERFLAGEPILARRPSPLRKAVVWARRHRWVIVAAASAAFLALGAVTFGLWQQTRYLLWVNAHPGWVRQPGTLTAALRRDSTPVLFLMPLLVASLNFYKKVSRALSWDEARRVSRFTPAHRIAPAWVAAFIGIAVAGGVTSIYLAALSVAAFVWEGYLSPPGLTVLWMALFFGVLLLGTVVREQLAATLGLGPAGQAGSDIPEEGEVYEALYAGRTDEAIRKHRDATGLDRAVARRQVMQAAARSFREHPERFSRDPTLPPPVAPRRLVAGSVVCLAALAVGTRLFLDADTRWPWSALYLCCVLLGAVAAARGIVVFWRRVVFIVSGTILVTFALTWYADRLQGGTMLAAITCGVATGGLLIAGARRRG